MRMKTYKGKLREAEMEEERAARAMTPVQRPSTPVQNSCQMVLHSQDVKSSRAILAKLVLDMRLDSHKLADKARGWGFKLLDDGIIGLNDRGIALLMQLPEVQQAVKVLQARRSVHSLSGDEARLLRMAADVNCPLFNAGT